MHAFRIACLFLAACPGMLSAQAVSPWQGEWGAYVAGHADQGRRLSVRNCETAGCHFNLEATLAANHAGNSSGGLLVFDSSTRATATLAAGTGQAPCILHFERRDSPSPSIEVSATGSSCITYFSTSAAVTMSGSYPLRTHATYNGPDQSECFLDPSPARLAICTSSELAALQQKWSGLALDFPLLPVAKGQPPYRHMQQANAAILKACDPAADPGSCLTARYSTDVAAMQARKDQYVNGTIQRGDPAGGAALATKISGVYRHSFRNGNVQGDKYTSTDTLTIRPAGAASIRFEAELNFFNGHTCSVSGGALYRKDGSFVFDDTPDNANIPDTPACRLAIIPGADGITFKDVNGGCRNYCGMRGSWDGAGFTFRERVVQPHKTAAKR